MDNSTGEIIAAVGGMGAVAGGGIWTLVRRKRIKRIVRSAVDKEPASQADKAGRGLPTTYTHKDMQLAIKQRAVRDLKARGYKPPFDLDAMIEEAMRVSAAKTP